MDLELRNGAFEKIDIFSTNIGKVARPGTVAVDSKL